MAAAVGKFAANKLLKQQMKKHKGKKVEGGEVSNSQPLLPIHTIFTNSDTQDPYFALIEDPNRPGKYKKVKKQIPAYIPERDAEVLASVRKSAYRLDMCLFDFLGIRFGWEAVIGIIPAFGDAVGVLLALMVFKKCCSVEGGLDSSIKVRMMINIILDFVVGLVPFVGDLADAAFKCNTKNLRLLENTLDTKYKPSSARRDERDFVGVDRDQRRKNRASGIYGRNDPPPATAFEDFSDDEVREMERDRDPGLRHPEPARAPTGSRRTYDVEMTQTRPSRQESRRERR